MSRKKYNITKDLLYDLYYKKQLTPKEISEKIGCDRSLIYFYIKKYNISHVKKYKRIKGKKFGLLTVVELVGFKNKCALWRCICDCGGEKIVPVQKLENGGVKSCGCLNHKPKHNLSGHPLYSIWIGIKSRCTNKKASNYKTYGGRGITICNEWLNFENFYKDMSPSYKKGLSIDRIDNNKGYYKENCRWANDKEQSNNKRNCIYIKYNNEIKTATQWSEKFNFKRRRLYYLISKGIDKEKALKIVIKETNKATK